MSRTKSNKEAIYRFMHEIWSQGNLETVDELFETEIKFILSFAQTHGKEQFKKLLNINRKVFEKLTYHVHDRENDIVADKKKGAAFWTMTGIHVGPWRNIPGTNKEVSIQGISFFKFNKEGKITEVRVQNDVIALMTQLNGVKMLFE